jgi:hypothetical protein
MPRLLLPALLSLTLCMPIGGFIFGLVNAEDCDGILANVLGRPFIGLVFAFLTVAFWGFPPRNGGGVGEPFNVWPYILPVAIVLFVTFAALTRRKRRSHTDKQA